MRNDEKLGVPTRILLSMLCIALPSAIVTLFKYAGIILGAIPYILVYAPGVMLLKRMWGKPGESNSVNKPSPETNSVQAQDGEERDDNTENSKANEAANTSVSSHQMKVWKTATVVFVIYSAILILNSLAMLPYIDAYNKPSASYTSALPTAQPTIKLQPKKTIATQESDLPPAPSPYRSRSDMLLEKFDYDRHGKKLDGEQAYVDASTLNLRNEPNQQAEILCQAERGTELVVLSEDNEWYYVYVKGYGFYGYMKKEHVTLGAPD